MVNCTYCNKELDRQIFCSGSHKVMYHRKGKESSDTKYLEAKIKLTKNLLEERAPTFKEIIKTVPNDTKLSEVLKASPKLPKLTKGKQLTQSKQVNKLSMTFEL